MMAISDILTRERHDIEKVKDESLSLMVKSDLTNSQYTIYTETIVKLYDDITNSHDDPVLSRRLVKSLFTIAGSYFGLDVILHLHTHRAYTHLELWKKYGVTKQTAHRIKERLVNLDIMNPEAVTIKSRPNPSKRGPHPAVYTAIDATPEDVTNAIERYFTHYPKPSDTKHQGELISIADEIESFFQKRSINDVSIGDLNRYFSNIYSRENIREIAPILRERGIKVWG